MSTALICSALELSPDRWPPDHYALLGLPVGDVDAAAVEERVLDRMERLRRYQLADPDAVTEAMNRLAQALVCLSDPAAKAEYDKTLQPGTRHSRPIKRDEEDEPLRAYDLAPPEHLTVAPVLRQPKPPAKSRSADPRRDLYRRLSATRRLLAAWRDVGDYLAQPAARPMRPTEGIEFVGKLLELRERLADDAAPTTGLPGQPGALVTALARQPLPLTAYRHLGPEQRITLATDWQIAANRLAAAYAEIGRAVRRHHRAAPQRALRKFGRAIVTDRLDLTLFVLGLAALGLALLRAL